MASWLTASGTSGGARISFATVTPAFQTFWTSWQDTVCCACGTLCKILKTLPIFPTVLFVLLPIPNVVAAFPFIAGDQIKDSQTWCAIENAINAVFEAVRIILKLVFDLILLPVTGFVNRPNFRPLANLICATLDCAIRSLENSLQGFWDCFGLFPFNFEHWLCIADTAGCIVIKLAALILHIIVHIDEIVNFPMNPYWGTIIKRDVTEILNLIGAPSNTRRIVNPDTGISVRIPFVSLPVIKGENGPIINQTVAFTIDAYYWDVNSPLTPLGEVNLVYGKRRLTDCLCIFLQRALCDPRVNETICFQLDPDGIGASILADFDLCCIVQSLGTAIVDIISALYEMSLHLDFAANPDDFFLYLDRTPFDVIIKDSLLDLGACILNILTLIPAVGECLKFLLLEWFRFLACVGK